MTTRRGFRYDFGSSRMEVLVDGTIAGRFNNVSPHLSLSSALEVGSGGTGVTSLNDHYVLLGSGTGAITPITPSTSGYILTSNGTSADPSFQIAAWNVASGGTGATSLTDHYVLLGSGTGAITPVTPGASGLVLTSNGTGSDPTFQAASTTSAGFTMAIS